MFILKSVCHSTRFILDSKICSYCVKRYSDHRYKSTETPSYSHKLLKSSKKLKGEGMAFIGDDDYSDDEDYFEFKSEIFHGESIVDRKSIFQGHSARVYRYDQVKLMIEKLKENKKIENAFHNMYAYRIDKKDKNAKIAGKSSNIDQDCDDDGEQAAGGRLLSLLQIMNIVNVVIVVTRWYGGIQLGPARFKHINNAARDALVKGGFVNQSNSSEQETSSSKLSKKGGSKKKK